MTQTMPHTRGGTPRFGRLARHFLMRLSDFELVAPGGEAHQTAVTGMALLGALNFIIALCLVIREVFAPAAFEKVRTITILGDASLIVALTMLLEPAQHLHPTDQLSDRPDRNRASAHHSDSASQRRACLQSNRGARRRVEGSRAPLHDGADRPATPSQAAARMCLSQDP